MQSFFDFFMMLMNMAQTYNHQQQPYPNPYAQNPYTAGPQNFPPNPYGSVAPFGTPPSPFGSPFGPFGSQLPNVQFIPGQFNQAKSPEAEAKGKRTTIPPIFQPYEITAIPPVLNIPSAFNKSVLEVKMNKCCPINYYYSEDSKRRMKCKKHTSDLDRIVGKTKVFKTVRQYTCEASMGRYVDDLSQLDINGEGFLKYKGETYEKYCMDYDIRMSKFIIIKCNGKKVEAQRAALDHKESRVMNILKKRAQRLNEVDRPAIKKPKLKTAATKRTTTVAPSKQQGTNQQKGVSYNTRPTTKQPVTEDESAEYYYDSVEEDGVAVAETTNHHQQQDNDDSVEEIEYSEEEYEEIEFVPLPSTTTTTTTASPISRMSTRIKLKPTSGATQKKLTTLRPSQSTPKLTKSAPHARPALLTRSAVLARSASTTTTTTTTQKAPSRISTAQKTPKLVARASNIHPAESSEEYEEEYEVEYEYE